MDEKYKAFLQELSELSKKHKITIGSCSCCDSMWLTKHDNLDGEYTAEWNQWSEYPERVAFDRK